VAENSGPAKVPQGKETDNAKQNLKATNGMKIYRPGGDAFSRIGLCHMPPFSFHHKYLNIHTPLADLGTEAASLKVCIPWEDKEQP
jgi:hypothetical protein